MLKIYHNNRCSKSREALALLNERGLAVEVIHYLDTPPDAATLALLLQKLGYSARQLLRSKEAEYNALGLDDPSLSEAALIAAMVQTPKLIERPIIEWPDKAVIARPPVQLQDLL
jgi:arsenate reductase